MKVEVSNGELLDKLSILRIKQQKINDEFKLKNINTEVTILEQLSSELLKDPVVLEKYLELSKINEKLWDIEDRIREKEYLKIFDEEFIGLARRVYITNDLRASIKKDINKLTMSHLVEEKSYKSY